MKTSIRKRGAALLLSMAMVLSLLPNLGASVQIAHAAGETGTCGGTNCNESLSHIQDVTGSDYSVGLASNGDVHVWPTAGVTNATLDDKVQGYLGRQDNGQPVQLKKRISEKNQEADVPTVDGFGSTSGKLIVHEGFTTVADDTFYGTNGLKDIVLPASLTTIGESAFRSLSTLESVTFPESGVTGNLDIQTWAFRYDLPKGTYPPRLTSIDLPEGTRQIRQDAFWKNGLTSVTIPEGVMTIGKAAFKDNALTGSVTIPGTVTTISEMAFQNNALTSVTITEGVTSIGYNAFDNNALTGSVTIPGTLTTIDSSVFQNNALTSVTISEGVTTIGVNAFKNNALESVTIPGSVTSIGNSAFENNALTSVTIPEGVTTIGEKAFKDNELTSVTIPESVTGQNLKENAFQNNALTQVTLSSGLTWIGDYAFADNRLTSVTIPDQVVTIGTGAFRNNAITSVTIPGNVTKIWNSVFENNQLTSVTIEGTSDLEIESHVFRNNKLTSINIPKRVKKIGQAAFSYQSRDGAPILNEIKFNGKSTGFTKNGENSDFNTALTFDDNAFEGDFARDAKPTLKELKVLYPNLWFNFSDEYTNMECGDEGCGKILTTVHARDNVYIGIDDDGDVHVWLRERTLDTKLGKTARAYLGQNLKVNVDQKAEADLPTAEGFEEASGKLIVHEGITAIGREAFDRTMGLKAVELPASLTTIEQWAFSSIPTLQEVTFADNAEGSNRELTIQSNAFRYDLNTAIEQYIPEGFTIKLPTGLKKIEGNAFLKARLKDTLDIPKSVTTIDEGAFNTHADYPVENITFNGSSTFNTTNSDLVARTGNTGLHTFSFEGTYAEPAQKMLKSIVETKPAGDTTHDFSYFRPDALRALHVKNVTFAGESPATVEMKDIIDVGYDNNTSNFMAGIDVNGTVHIWLKETGAGKNTVYRANKVVNKMIKADSPYYSDLEAAIGVQPNGEIVFHTGITQITSTGIGADTLKKVTILGDDVTIAQRVFADMPSLEEIHYGGTVPDNVISGSDKVVVIGGTTDEGFDILQPTSTLEYVKDNELTGNVVITTTLRKGYLVGYNYEMSLINPAGQPVTNVDGTALTETITVSAGERVKVSLKIPQEAFAQYGPGIYKVRVEKKGPATVSAKLASLFNGTEENQENIWTEKTIRVVETKFVVDFWDTFKSNANKYAANYSDDAEMYQKLAGITKDGQPFDGKASTMPNVISPDTAITEINKAKASGKLGGTGVNGFNTDLIITKDGAIDGVTDATMRYVAQDASKGTADRFMKLFAEFDKVRFTVDGTAEIVLPELLSDSQAWAMSGWYVSDSDIVHTSGEQITLKAPTRATSGGSTVSDDTIYIIPAWKVNTVLDRMRYDNARNNRLGYEGWKQIPFGYDPKGEKDTSTNPVTYKSKFWGFDKTANEDRFDAYRLGEYEKNITDQNTTYDAALKAEISSMTADQLKAWNAESEELTVQLWLRRSDKVNVKVTLQKNRGEVVELTTTPIASGELAGAHVTQLTSAALEYADYGQPGQPEAPMRGNMNVIFEVQRNARYDLEVTITEMNEDGTLNENNKSVYQQTFTRAGVKIEGDNETITETWPKGIGSMAMFQSRQFLTRHGETGSDAANKISTIYYYNLPTSITEVVVAGTASSSDEKIQLDYDENTDKYTNDELKGVTELQNIVVSGASILKSDEFGIQFYTQDQWTSKGLKPTWDVLLDDPKADEYYFFYEDVGGRWQPWSDEENKPQGAVQHARNISASITAVDVTFKDAVKEKDILTYTFTTSPKDNDTPGEDDITKGRIKAYRQSGDRRLRLMRVLANPDQGVDEQILYNPEDNTHPINGQLENLLNVKHNKTMYDSKVTDTLQKATHDDIATTAADAASYQNTIFKLEIPSYIDAVASPSVYEKMMADPKISDEEKARYVALELAGYDEPYEKDDPQTRGEYHPGKVGTKIEVVNSSGGKYQLKEDSVTEKAGVRITSEDGQSALYYAEIVRVAPKGTPKLSSVTVTPNNSAALDVEQIVDNNGTRWVATDVEGEVYVDLIAAAADSDNTMSEIVSVEQKGEKLTPNKNGVYTVNVKGQTVTLDVTVKLKGTKDAKYRAVETIVLMSPPPDPAHSLKSVKVNDKVVFIEGSGYSDSVTVEADTASVSVALEANDGTKITKIVDSEESEVSVDNQSYTFNIDVSAIQDDATYDYTVYVSRDPADPASDPYEIGLSVTVYKKKAPPSIAQDDLTSAEMSGSNPYAVTWTPNADENQPIIMVPGATAVRDESGKSVTISIGTGGRIDTKGLPDGTKEITVTVPGESDVKITFDPPIGTTTKKFPLGNGRSIAVKDDNATITKASSGKGYVVKWEKVTEGETPVTSPAIIVKPEDAQIDVTVNGTQFIENPIDTTTGRVLCEKMPGASSIAVNFKDDPKESVNLTLSPALDKASENEYLVKRAADDKTLANVSKDNSVGTGGYAVEWTPTGTNQPIIVAEGATAVKVGDDVITGLPDQNGKIDTSGLSEGTEQITIVAGGTEIPVKFSPLLGTTTQKVLLGSGRKIMVENSATITQGSIPDVYDVSWTKDKENGEGYPTITVDPTTAVTVRVYKDGDVGDAVTGAIDENGQIKYENLLDTEKISITFSGSAPVVLNLNPIPTNPTTTLQSVKVNGEAADLESDGYVAAVTVEKDAAVSIEVQTNEGAKVDSIVGTDSENVTFTSKGTTYEFKTPAISATAEYVYTVMVSSGKAFKTEFKLTVNATVREEAGQTVEIPDIGTIVVGSGESDPTTITPSKGSSGNEYDVGGYTEGTNPEIQLPTELKPTVKVDGTEIEGALKDDGTINWDKIPKETDQITVTYPTTPPTEVTLNFDSTVGNAAKQEEPGDTEVTIPGTGIVIGVGDGENGDDPTNTTNPTIKPGEGGNEVIVDFEPGDGTNPPVITVPDGTEVKDKDDKPLDDVFDDKGNIDTGKLPDGTTEITVTVPGDGDEGTDVTIKFETPVGTTETKVIPSEGISIEVSGGSDAKIAQDKTVKTQYAVTQTAAGNPTLTVKPSTAKVKVDGQDVAGNRIETRNLPENTQLIALTIDDKTYTITFDPAVVGKKTNIGNIEAGSGTEGPADPTNPTLKPTNPSEEGSVTDITVEYNPTNKPEDKPVIKAPAQAVVKQVIPVDVSDEVKAGMIKDGKIDYSQVPVGTTAIIISVPKGADVPQELILAALEELEKAIDGIDAATDFIMVLTGSANEPQSEETENSEPVGDAENEDVPNDVTDVENEDISNDASDAENEDASDNVADTLEEETSGEPGREEITIRFNPPIGSTETKIALPEGGSIEVKGEGARITVNDNGGYDVTYEGAQPTLILTGIKGQSPNVPSAGSAATITGDTIKVDTSELAPKVSSIGITIPHDYTIENDLFKVGETIKFSSVVGKKTEKAPDTSTGKVDVPGGSVEVGGTTKPNVTLKPDTGGKTEVIVDYTPNKDGDTPEIKVPDGADKGNITDQNGNKITVDGNGNVKDLPAGTTEITVPIKVNGEEKDVIIKLNPPAGSTPTEIKMPEGNSVQVGGGSNDKTTITPSKGSSGNEYDVGGYSGTNPTVKLETPDGTKPTVTVNGGVIEGAVKDDGTIDWSQIPSTDKIVVTLPTTPAKTLTLNFDPKVGSKPSSSGGGAGGGTVTPPDTTNPTEPTTPSADSTGKVDGNGTLSAGKGETNAAMKDLIDQASKEENGKKPDNVTLVVKPPEGSQAQIGGTSITIDKNQIADMGDKTDADLTIQTPNGSVTLGNGALSQLGKGDGDVNVNLNKGADDAMTVEIKKGSEAVKEIPDGILLEIPGSYTTGHVVIVTEDGKERVVRKSHVVGDVMKVRLNGNATFKIENRAMGFDDVPDTHWAKDAIDSVTARDLFRGISDTQFAPSMTMSRSMLVTVLHRLEDTPAGGVNKFSDIESGTWYTDAVAWASANGIVQGTTDTSFSPDDDVTREQIALFLYRYAKLVKYPTESTGELSSYQDGGTTSSWAREAMSWAVGAGLLKGDDNGALRPTASATRAEVATMIMRFCQMLLEA